MFETFRAWMQRMWAEQVISDEPAELARPKPWDVINGEFVLLLADGNYYAGSAGGKIVRTSNPEQAQHFPNRWAALHAAGKGVEFDRASIVPYVPRRQRA